MRTLFSLSLYLELHTFGVIGGNVVLNLSPKLCLTNGETMVQWLIGTTEDKYSDMSQWFPDNAPARLDKFKRSAFTLLYQLSDATAGFKHAASCRAEQSDVLATLDPVRGVGPQKLSHTA